MSKLGPGVFVRGRRAFYSLVSRFAAVETQVVVYAVLVFSWGKASTAFQGGRSSSSGINFSVFVNDFSDLGVVASTEIGRSSSLSSWICKGLPIVIDFSSLLYQSS